MNLKSLFMGHFGLFRGRLMEFGPAFNLIFGPNESGKTTLVDAIVVSLLTRTQKKGDGLKGIPRALTHLKERYGSEISLQMFADHDGQEVEFPAPENFQDLWDLGWDELRAIFIAREGDLELASGTPREFRTWWESLKGKLLGFEEEPRKVLSKVAAEADLTDNLGLTTMQKDRRKNIQETLTWFDENQPRIKTLRELERHYGSLQADEKRLAQEAERAEQGLQKSRLLQAQEIHQKMKATQERLREEYGRYSEKDAQEWKKLAHNSDQEAAQTQWLREQREKEEARHRETITRAAELAKRINSLSEKLRATAEREQELGEVAVEERKGTRGTIPAWSPWISWAGAILALILGVHSDTLGLLLIGIILVALALVLTYLLRRESRRFSQLRRRREGLLIWGRELGIEAETLPDLLKQKMDLQREKDEFEGQRKTLEDQLPKLTRTIDDLNQKERARLAEIESIRKQILHLRDRVGLADLEELEKRLQIQKELYSDVEKKFKGSLRVLLGPNESAWSREIDRLKSMEQIQPVEDEGLVKKLQRELESLRHQRDDVFQELTGLTAEVKLHFKCQRLEEVFWKVADLRRELKELEILEHAGVRVRETFDRVLQQSDAVLDKIIGGEAVCRSFQKITAGRYQTVAMDDLNLRVTDNEGRQWPFSTLSSGTRDQLLMVLRLALAERRLHGKGFLILDDPLVNSDRARLKEQMDVLGQLARDGWQILFLTAQDEVRQEVERLENAGVEVNFIDL